MADNISWADAASKLLLPLLLAVSASAGAMITSELSKVREEVRMLQISVAQMQVELKLHSTK
jgi:hypothetical protein